MRSAVSITLPGSLAGRLVGALRRNRNNEIVENVVFGLAQPYSHAGHTVLRVQQLLEFLPDCYQVREHYAVQLAPHALARVVSEVRERRLVPIKFHRHPLFGGRAAPEFSPTDDAADRELLGLFSDDGGFGSVLLADTLGGSYTVRARASVGRSPLGSALVVEQRLPHIVHPTGESSRSTHPRFDRSCLEFGAGVINTLSEARLGVIGCGGLGWRAACASADSGVASLVLIDRDKIGQGNLPRLEAALPEDVGEVKVDRLRRYLEARYDDLEISDLEIDVVEVLDKPGPQREELVSALASCEVLLLVTDNHPSRLAVLSVAESLGVPYVHCGMHQIGKQDMYCRLSVHVPGSSLGCGVCVGHIDRGLGSLRGRGYIEGVRLPNVAAWNSIAAGYVANAVRQLLSPLLGDSLRDCSAWEIGLSTPAVRQIPNPRDPECPVCS